MRKFIVVNLQVEGVHAWSDCPIEQVSYLRNEHRHIFFITLEKVVQHNDRDIEIIMFKKEVKDYLNSEYGVNERGICNFGNMSCEDIAEILMIRYKCESVKVLEDNENGAKIIR